VEFKFSEDEEDLRKAVSDFTQKELVTKKFNNFTDFPASLFKQMSTLGFFSLRIPQEYGGLPASWVDIGILVEEIAKGNIDLAYLLILSYEVNLLLAACAKKEIVEQWLPDLTNGIKLGSISLTEPQAGYDLGSMRTVAVKKKDSYVISGEKCPVSFGIQADFTVLLASTASGAAMPGITAFLVPLNFPGVSRSPNVHTGLLSSTPALITFDNVHVPINYRLGEEGEGLLLNRKYGLFSDLNQILCALASLGLCQVAFKLAVSYSKERSAFGRPIAQFQAISERIAENATLIEAGRWLCYRPLWLKDQNLSNAKQAAMCGWWCTRNAYRVIEDALLIHGHIGYTDDQPFQQMLRDVLAFEMIAGTRQALQLLIAEDVIGKAAVPREIIR